MSSVHTALTKRERQIMDVLFRLGRATAADVLAARPGSPHYSTVRTQLRVLEEKGHVRHESEGLRYVYLPTLARHTARKAALRHLVETFFDGSAAGAVTALLGRDAGKLSDEDLDRIEGLLKSSRREEK
jgi:predicted transcriptional regulator